MFLVDGSNHAFRVHFALPPMHAPDGFPTSALYGFTTMFARILRVYEPDYVVVCFDIGKSFRSDLYPDYKGHRPSMPDDLRAQWPHFPSLVEGFGFKSLAIEGYEADDVIGTIAKKYASDDLEVWMLTSDKDFYQLIDANTKVLDLMKDLEIGPDEVQERFGVPPELVVDVRGLSGDKSDNIPGVPGIGDKTASKLVNQYGTLEAVLEASPTIKGKRGENLREYADDAVLSKQLSTIYTEVPLDYDLDDFAPAGMQNEALAELFERFNFGKVARKLLRTAPEVDTSVYRAVTTEAELADVVASLRAAGRFGFDTETTSLDTQKARLVGISVAWTAKDAVYIPMAHEEGEQLGVDVVLAALKPLLEDPELLKIGQNLKYDLKVCLNHGVTLRGIGEDTMLLDYVLSAHERSHKLDNLASRHLFHNMTTY
ncbi:MAG: DNA polymerase-1, partial [Kiritimatiellia bacterium]